MADDLRVVFPIYQGCTLVDFAGATQVFAFADGFSPIWVAPGMEPISTTEGVSVMPNSTLADAPRADILFVPGGGSAVAKRMQDQAYLDYLREAGTQAQWAGSVCSGGFLTATAGLLDGCEATTYWSLLDVFALFPTLKVAPGYPRWHLDRENRRFSGGGVSSSLDLALELVVTIASRETAERAQLAIQYAPGPPTSAGDPSEAPPELTEQVREEQEGFIQIMRAATLAVIHGQ